jgi:mRNA interferase RelE/StbE
MPHYKIAYSRQAQKFLEDIDKKVALQIFKKIEALYQNPFQNNLDIKKLKNDLGYRLRVSDYRVIYKIVNFELKIEVIKIGHRKDIYE